jgi:hypothetical protein
VDVDLDMNMNMNATLDIVVVRLQNGGATAGAFGHVADCCASATRVGDLA